MRDFGIKATFFIVAKLVEKYDYIFKQIAGEGHEIGSHGFDHSRLDKLDVWNAESNIIKSIKILSKYNNVESFRAPNLQLPERLIPTLIREGITVDSSIAIYKRKHPKHPHRVNGLLRVPVTSTSSTIRLPLRLAVKATLPRSREFYSLFYHPWEFVKIPRRPVYRPDIWIRTGVYAREALIKILDRILASGYRFVLMRDAPRFCI